MANINQTRQNQTKPDQTMKNAGVDVGGVAVTAGGSTLGKSVWKVLKEREINLPHDPATPLLSVYPEDSIFYLLIPVHCCSIHKCQKIKKA